MNPRTLRFDDVAGDDCVGVSGLFACRPQRFARIAIEPLGIDRGEIVREGMADLLELGVVQAFPFWADREPCHGPHVEDQHDNGFDPGVGGLNPRASPLCMHSSMVPA